MLFDAPQQMLENDGVAGFVKAEGVHGVSLAKTGLLADPSFLNRYDRKRARRGRG